MEIVRVCDGPTSHHTIVEGGCACVSVESIRHPSRVGALGLTDRELQLSVGRNHEQLQQLSSAADVKALLEHWH